MIFDSKAFGIRVKKLRENQNLTQEQLGELLNITTKHLSKIETGLRGPSVQLIITLSEKLHISTDYLLGQNTEKKDEMLRDVDVILAACKSLRKKI